MPKATFHPQAWQNDYTIDVDPEGETEWEVTEEEIEAALKHWRGTVYGPDFSREQLFAADDYPSDEFRHSKNAPQWVRDWSGPFYISFDEPNEAYGR